GPRLLRSIVRDVDSAGGYNARPLDETFLDVVSKRDVSFCRTATRQHRRITCIEQFLHLLLLIRAGIDVPMAIDETRHRRHSMHIDRLPPVRVRTAGADRNQLPATNDDRTAIDHGSITDDDPRVRDHQVLRREIPRRTGTPKEGE